MTSSEFCTRATKRYSIQNRPSDLSARLGCAIVLIAVLATSPGCASFEFPRLESLDLMNPSSSLLFSGANPQGPQYQMLDGTSPESVTCIDGSLDMNSYQKIREAKALGAVVLQVEDDPQPVRVLPLPPEQKSVFVSELLTQTGIIKKFGSVDATLYRPSPNSIAGTRMDIKFKDDGTVDPISDYGLRPGDRIQVRKKTTSPLQSLVDLALQR